MTPPLPPRPLWRQWLAFVRGYCGFRSRKWRSFRGKSVITPSAPSSKARRKSSSLLSTQTNTCTVSRIHYVIKTKWRPKKLKLHSLSCLCLADVWTVFSAWVTWIKGQETSKCTSKFWWYCSLFTFVIYSYCYCFLTKVETWTLPIYDANCCF